MEWSYDTSGMFSKPVITLDNRFKYVVCDDSDSIKVYQCLYGCNCWVSVGSRTDIVDGWEQCTKYLFNITSFDNHSCLGQIDLLKNMDMMMNNCMLPLLVF